LFKCRKLSWIDRIVRSSVVVFDDDVAGFFADHINVRHDKHAWDFWENGGIDDAEAFDAANAKATVQDRPGIVGRPDAARAAGVMPPGLLPDPVLELLVRLYLLAGPNLCPGGERAFLDRTNKLHPL